MSVVGHTFRTRLAVEIDRAGSSPQLISHHTGITPKTIDRWLEGTTEPSLDLAWQVARHLGVSLDYLTGRAETPNGRFVGDAA